MGSSCGLSQSHAPQPCGPAFEIVGECPQNTDGHAPSRDDGGAPPASGLCGSAECTGMAKALCRNPGRVAPCRWYPAVHPRCRVDVAARSVGAGLSGGALMLQLTPQSRIFLATQPVDFRKGIDGLCAVCRHALGDNPLEGAVYVFRNRSATALKLLCYDGQGFWLLMKRLSQGRFTCGPRPRTHACPCRLGNSSLCCGTATPKVPRWRKIGDAWPKARPGLSHRSRATTPPGPQRRRRGALATPPGSP